MIWGEYLTAFQAYLRMCRQLRGWVSAELAALPNGNAPAAGSPFIPEKPCQQFVFDLLVVFDLLEFDGDGESTLYVWPDGDRSVTRHSEGKRYLSGAAVSDFTFGGGECWTNAASGNRFCADYTEAGGEC